MRTMAACLQRGLPAFLVLMTATMGFVASAADREVLQRQLAQATSGYDVTDVPVYSRDWVSELQSELKEAGYAVDTESGAFTEQTREAIAQFQSKAGLTVNGQPTPSLMRALRSDKIKPEGVD
jgi:peptidoglycan hydrolase-like protein with peptidoglycan-binding domain